MDLLRLSVRTRGRAEEARDLAPGDMPIVLGRSSSCGLVLADPTCSRRQARIACDEGRYTLHPLETVNPTLLNGRPAAGQALGSGDRIGLGGTEIIVALLPVPVLELTLRGEARRYDMGMNALLVGRGSGCDLRVEDPSCSRRQLRLELRSGEVWAEDLGGVNRTLLNGHPLTRARLAPGDALSLGAATLRLSAGGVPQDIPGDDPVAAPRPRILLSRRRRKPSLLPAAVLLVLGGGAGALLAYGAARALSFPSVAPPAPSGDRRPSVLPPAPAAGTAPDGQGALAGARSQEAAASGDYEALIRRYRQVALDFPGSEAALSALEASRAVRARWMKAQDERLASVLEAAAQARQAGDPRAARACLTAFLEQGADAGSLDRIQREMAALDAGMERECEDGMARALALSRSGRFAEARAGLVALRLRFAGLPWGSAAEARLAELDALEAEAAAKRRDEDEARRSAAESARLRAEWRERQAAFARMLPGLPAAGRAGRRAAFEAIAAFDPAVGEGVLAALALEQRRLLARLKGRLGERAVRSLRLELDGSLAERRKAALAIILDPQRYPYFHGQPNPYGPDGARIQREVEALVKAVEEAYRPTRRLLETLQGMKGLGDVLDGLGEVEGYLARAGSPPAAADCAGGVLAEALGGLDYAREAEAERENAAVLAANEAAALRLASEGAMDGQEADCVLATNRYRIMMGLRPLRIDPRLVAASRGHSRDMVRRGYFAHVDPDGKGPGERARDAGFTGRVSENIHAGQATGHAAFAGWCGSSGHHRNLLTPAWTLIGVGRDGNRWTMMPGN